MLIAYSLTLMLAPERAVPGSSGEPARALGLMFASRTLLLGGAFLALALRDLRVGLAWVFFGDAALQVFDTGLAIAAHKGAVAALPVLIGALEVWAGRQLLRPPPSSHS
jgi:hypothetical protein